MMRHETLVQALVNSRLDYGNALLHNIPSGTAQLYISDLIQMYITVRMLRYESHSLLTYQTM